jgi:hypothetical protein
MPFICEQKLTKTVENWFLTILTSISSYSIHKFVLWSNEWCSIILCYQPRCLLHSWPHIVTLWAILATQLWAKMAENGLKQVFDDTYLHMFFFYTEICSMGQQVVFNYPMLSPKMPTTLVTPNSYPMGHYSLSLVSKNGRKRLKTGFLMILTSITSYSTHKSVLWANECCSIILWYHPRCLLQSWPHLVTLWATIASICDQKWPKTVENRFLTTLTS